MTHRVLSNNSYAGVESSEDGDMVMVNPVNLSTRDLGQIDEGDEHEVIGPKLVPLTPIMRFAMREVVQEYEDVRTVSEYASLNDPDLSTRDLGQIDEGDEHEVIATLHVHHCRAFVPYSSMFVLTPLGT